VSFGEVEVWKNVPSLEMTEVSREGGRRTRWWRYEAGLQIFWKNDGDRTDRRTDRSVYNMAPFTVNLTHTRPSSFCRAVEAFHHRLRFIPSNLVLMKLTNVRRMQLRLFIHFIL